MQASTLSVALASISAKAYMEVKHGIGETSFKRKKTLLWPIIKWLASAYFRHTEALTVDTVAGLKEILQILQVSCHLI